MLLGELTDAFVYHEASQILANERVDIHPSDLVNLISSVGIPEPGSTTGFNARCLSRQGPDTNASIHVDFKEITGGEVNCTATYRIIIPPFFPVEFTLTAVLQYCFGSIARCEDDEIFTDAANRLIIGFAGVVVMAMLLGAAQVGFYQSACERQVEKIRLQYYRAILRQDIGWFDVNACGEVCYRLSE